MQDYIWQIEGHSARLRLGPLQGTVDLTAPHLGVHDLVLHGQAVPHARLLSVSVPSVAAAGAQSLIDSYCRGNDLVATYEDVAAHPVRVQVYWRAVPSTVAAQAESAAAIELLTSVQTHLLDTDPAIQAATHLPAGEFRQVHFLGDSEDSSRMVSRPQPSTEQAMQPGDGFTFTPSAGAWTYSEMVHPVDYQQSTATNSADAVTISHGLFCERLEKGVILRARIRALLLRDEMPPETAQQFFQEFATAELPLTT